MRIVSYVILSITIICAISCSKNNTEDILKYVDPMIGTDGLGHTFPGATTPLGMIQISPSEDSTNRSFNSGYHYSNTVIKGFSHNHFSGTGLTGMADLLLMPTSGEVMLNSGTVKNPDTGYRSRFSHENEEASAGYYAVLLEDYNIKAELTCTPRIGFHRYTYNKADQKNIIIDPTHVKRERMLDAQIEVISNTEIKGYKNSQGGVCGKRKTFFHVEFSHPFSSYGLAIGDSILSGATKVQDKDAKMYVSFDHLPNDLVEAKVAISYVDYAGAKANFDAEVVEKTFEQVHHEAREMWREKISKIKIESKSEKQKKIFYTAMYHSFIAPNIISDVNGNYIVEGKKYTSKDIIQYSNISTWDTYRATHPLWTIIDQKADADLVNVLISRYTESDAGMGLWEALGHDICCMIGYSGISVTADAVMKNLPGIDQSLAFDCMKQAAFDNRKSSPNYGKANGVDYYVNLSFVPAEIGCGVSKTTEYNYYDWCIAEVAHKLGRDDDEKLFRERSLGYKNLYNAQTNYLWPKLSNGDWLEMDTTSWSSMKPNYISGNIWAYSAYTPHDMKGAIELFGGVEKYAAWLDMLFTSTLKMEGEQHVDISGFIGKYGHGDEPGHQMPYLFNFVDQPWKTQKLVREIMSTMYFDTPIGYINNEDCGQMSSWYIFSSLGFYPVCPGDLKYYIGSPLHDKATIRLENGNLFEVITTNNSEENIYIESINLNGQLYTKPFIHHEDIMKGGIMEFKMTAEPSNYFEKI